LIAADSGVCARLCQPRAASSGESVARTLLDTSARGDSMTTQKRSGLGLCMGLMLGLTPACSAGSKPSGGSSPAGEDVRLTLSADDSATLAALQTQVASTTGLSADQLIAEHAVEHRSLGYDPLGASGLSAIQASTLALDSDEQALLAKNGFVVSAKKSFPTMLYGYASFYVQDLPLYVSADSLLDSVHLSYDAMLEGIEGEALIPDLRALLDAMRAALAQRGQDDQAGRDADFFLAVAKSLLDGKPAAAVAGGGADVPSFVNAAMSAQGHDARKLFGVQRDIDWSQFKPRGHYTDSPALSNYFRAMIWLGRIDLRLIETQPDGSTLFHRRQLEAVLLLRDLVNSDALAAWTQIDDTLQAFVGASDYMRLPEVDALRKDLGVSDAAGLAALDDRSIAQAIVDGHYGVQLIASQLIVHGAPDGTTLPLDRSFALFGQRFVVDSQIFANVVYDRVPTDPVRLMPNPLDVAFAALRDDAAAPLLKGELDQYNYGSALESMRLLVDAHDDAFWNQNLYNLWLGALRSLSPDANGAGRPSVTASAAWDQRVLNTQLGSWAELRHDTILYAKQSYTSGLVCAYPAAYVEPYPDFFAALKRFAERGSALSVPLAADSSTLTATAVRHYFANLEHAASELEGMARAELAGTPFSDEQMIFINDAVHDRGVQGCAGPRSFDGWFAKLQYGAGNSGVIASEPHPTIADVHTQPTDAGGGDVGRILHVGTGLPRLLVASLDTCEGPHAYVGVVLSYYEQITDHWQRLDDEHWATALEKAPPAEVPWTASFVSPR
jgi:hypothetical protein